MNVITIESEAFAQIMNKLKSLEERFIEMKLEADYPLKEKWLDTEEVLKLLNTSKRTLQHHREENNISYSQIGYKVYYKASDIEKFLKENYKKIYKRPGKAK